MSLALHRRQSAHFTYTTRSPHVGRRLQATSDYASGELFEIASAHVTSFVRNLAFVELSFYTSITGVRRIHSRLQADGEPSDARNRSR